MGGGGAEGPEGASSLELAIHWRIRRAWLNWGKRKGEGWWDQGRGWGGIDKVGEEGEVEVALVSEEVDESGEPSGGVGGEKVEQHDICGNIDCQCHYSLLSVRGEIIS